MKILTWLRIAWDAVAAAFVDAALFVDEFVFGVAGEGERRQFPRPVALPGGPGARGPFNRIGGQGQQLGVGLAAKHLCLHLVQTRVDQRRIHPARCCGGVRDVAHGETPRVLEINDLLNLADALRDRAAQFAALEALGQE
ncbi:hypothetical protein [Mycolicibacterium fortuitum]